MTFVKKFVQGFGVVMATTILTIVSFPVGVTPNDVPPRCPIPLGYTLCAHCCHRVDVDDSMYFLLPNRSQKA